VSPPDLDVVELDGLRQRNAERTEGLSKRGFMIPGVELRYQRCILEVLAGDRLPEAQLLYERHIAETLDQAELDADMVEAEQRKQFLAGGAPPVGAPPAGLLRGAR
jgi:hypothetical protein